MCVINVSLNKSVVSKTHRFAKLFETFALRQIFIIHAYLFACIDIKMVDFPIYLWFHWNCNILFQIKFSLTEIDKKKNKFQSWNEITFIHWEIMKPHTFQQNESKKCGPVLFPYIFSPMRIALNRVGWYLIWIYTWSKWIREI